MTVYFIPGLGFDQRIFDHINIQPFQSIFINWIIPQEKESFSSYAQRMATHIPEKETCILIGHSLGGLIAQEIATFRKVKKIILISSIKSRAELPFHFKIIAPLKLHKLFTKESSISSLKYWGKNHDYDTPEIQALFKNMVGQQSNHYLQWALRQLSIWQPPVVPADTSIYHLHGDQDKTFPIKKIPKTTTTFNKAGHFMVYKQADQIQQSLRRILSSND